MYPPPTDIDRSLIDAITDKIRDYRADYYNRPSNDIAFMSVFVRTSYRLHCELVRILFLQTHRETDLFYADSGVQLAHSNQFHHRDSVFYSPTDQTQSRQHTRQDRSTTS